jgi:hypothetical protein
MAGPPTRKLLDEYLQYYPSGRVLICSGHSVAELSRLRLPTDPEHLLQKPFTAADLTQRVHRLLA